MTDVAPIDPNANGIATAQPPPGAVPPTTPLDVAAPAGSEGKPPGGDSAAVEPAPETREGRIYAAIREREKKLVREREQFLRERGEFDAYRTRTQADVEASQRAIQLAKTDPIRYLREAHGLTADQIAARLMNDGKPTVLDETAEMRRELSELRNWRDERTKAEKAAAEEAKRSSALETFTKVAREGAEKWPLASKYSDAKLKRRGWEIAAEHAQQGTILSDEEVLDRLEDELSEIASLRAPTTTATNAAKSEAAAAPKATPGTATQPAPTLTNGGSAEVAANAPIDIMKMSPDQLREHTLAVLREGRAKGTIRDD